MSPSSSSSHRARDFRRSRSRSRDTTSSRRAAGAARHDDKKAAAKSFRRNRERTPPQRAEFEIYIGNYPASFRESDVRKLFEEKNVNVTIIRMKHEGHKAFAFAETTSKDEIEKAIKELDSIEIAGRRLRVRSASDKDQMGPPEPVEAKLAALPKKELKETDLIPYIVFSFVNFLDRQLLRDDLTEDTVDSFKKAKDLLVKAFNLPDDESLKLSLRIEQVFFRTKILVREVKEAEAKKSTSSAASKDPTDEKDDGEKEDEDKKEVGKRSADDVEETDQEDVKRRKIDHQEQKDQEEDDFSDIVNALPDNLEEAVEQQQEDQPQPDPVQETHDHPAEDAGQSEQVPDQTVKEEEEQEEQGTDSQPPPTAAPKEDPEPEVQPDEADVSMMSVNNEDESAASSDRPEQQSSDEPEQPAKATYSSPRGGRRGQGGRGRGRSRRGSPMKGRTN